MTPSQKIDRLIAGIPDWRGKTFAAVRKTILAAEPGITEDWKWMGSPVWYKDGAIIAVANAHKGKVKLTFMHGAHVPDPGKLFNDGLDGNQRRAIDYFEGNKVDPAGLKALVHGAIAYSHSTLKKNVKAKPTKGKKHVSKKTSRAKKA